MTDIKFIIKPFHKLEIQELYEILALRESVFILEQNCLYQDIDFKDSFALHCMGYYDNELVAYSRIFDKGKIYPDHSAIGRVIIKVNHRKTGWGKQLMNFSIRQCQKNYGKHPIKLSGQSHLKNFYMQLGFMANGEEYLDDGIPHMGMIFEG